MPLYQYSAKDINSKTVKGRLEADNEESLTIALRDEGLFLLSHKEVSVEESASRRLKAKELADFSRQIGTMLSSGVSLVRALNILLQRSMKPRLHKIYSGVYRSLQQGNTISEALEAQGNAFPPLMVSMYRAGESSGQLEKTALKMATQYEKENRLNNKLTSASIYPIILILFTVAVMIGIFTAILPNFFTLFEEMDAEVPAITRFLMGVSNFLTGYWYWLIIGVLCIVALWSVLLRNYKVRSGLDRCKLKLPIFGKLLRIIYTARFARTLCSLYTSGLSMIHALNISRDIIGNEYIAGQFDKVITMVRNGSPLSQAVSSVDGFDPKLSSSIFVGEETGRLDDMLESMADDFDYEAEVASQRMVTIMEPMLILILAVMIGFVLISVMLPIWSIYSSLGAQGGM